MDGGFGNVFAAECTTTDCDVDFSEKVEKGDMLTGFSGFEPFLESFIVDFFLAGDICAQCLSSE
jgi:hypothetical protein